MKKYVDMKKTAFICSLATIVASVAGYVICLMVTNESEIINAQNAALRQAEIVMDNNNLWDIDGSDDMVEYMELYNKVDSILN